MISVASLQRSSKGLLQRNSWKPTIKSIRTIQQNSNIQRDHPIHSANLSDGRSDYKIFERLTVEAIIKDQGLDNLEVIELPSDQQPYVYPILAKGEKRIGNLRQQTDQRVVRRWDTGKLSKKYLVELTFQKLLILNKVI